MKKILLPTDFSKSSKNAILYAIGLYKKELIEVTFTLLHSFKVNDYQEDSRFIPVPSEVAVKKEKRSVQEKLQRIADKLKKDPEFSGINFNIVATNQPLTKAVKQQIKKDRAELVVIGTRGHTNSNGMTYGSHTLDLLEEITHCPVLAVPNGVKFGSIDEIVLANSYKSELSHADLKFLISFSKKLKSSIRVLHITEEDGLSELQKKNRDRLKEKLKDITHSFHSLEIFSIPLGIYSFTESRGSGVIAFINKKHSFIENTFLDPLYRNLAHYSKVPLLVLHQPR